MSGDDFSDIELIEACAVQSDERAWEIFVRRYSPSVWGAIRKTFRTYHVEHHAEELEDIYGQVFLSLLEDNCKKLRQFSSKNACSLKTWITIISGRLTIDYIRREKKHHVINSEEGKTVLGSIADSAFDPQKILERKQMDIMLLKAVDELSPKDKIIYSALFIRGITPQETASASGLSVPAVFTRKTRIIDKLKKTIQNL